MTYRERVDMTNTQLSDLYQYQVTRLQYILKTEHGNSLRPFRYYIVEAKPGIPIAIINTNKDQETKFRQSVDFYIPDGRYQGSTIRLELVFTFSSLAPEDVNKLEISVDINGWSSNNDYVTSTVVKTLDVRVMYNRIGSMFSEEQNAEITYAY